jgi:hypothetical protein
MVMSKIQWIVAVVASLALLASKSTTTTHALSSNAAAGTTATRRAALGWMAGTATGWMVHGSNNVNALVGTEDKLPDRFNVEDYLKTGQVMNPMGVSGQAGK